MSLSALPRMGAQTVIRQRRQSADGEEAFRVAVKPMRAYAQDIPEPGVGSLRFDDFPYQEEWYSEEIADAEEVVFLKSTQVGQCLDPSTRVLTADLRWVRISSLAPGDAIVGVDEHPPMGRGNVRAMRPAVIEARRDVVRESVRVTLSDGAVLIGSLEHRMLVRDHPGRASDWVEMGDMRIGQQIRRACDVWDEPTYEDGWFGGILDGEGHLASSGVGHHLRQRATGAEVVVSQQRGVVYDRAARWLSDQGIVFNERLSPRPGRPPVGRLSVSCTRDLMRIMGQTRPSKYVGERWWSGLRIPGTGRDDSRESWPRVVSVERCGERDLVDLQTSTATFIADGLVSHNSAYAWRWAVRQSDQFGETGLYIFPTDTHVTEFGDERIEPAIEESPYLRSRILPRFVHTKRLKRIGAGFLHLRGSNSKAGAQSVAASFIVFDEYDHLDPKNLPQIERRISGARQLGLRPRIRRLGTPTIEGVGISAAYEQSDQREWMVTCPGCGEVQAVEWNANVRWRNEPGGTVMRPGHDVYEDPRRVVEAWRACRDCETPLDVREGSWIARVPGRTVIGFHVSRLIVPRTDLAQIIVASRQTNLSQLEAFHNNDLGLAWSPAEAALEVAAILAACAEGVECPLIPEGYVGASPVTMGVDVAGERDLNVRISEQLPPEVAGVANPRRALWVGTVDTFEKVAWLMDAYRVHVCAVDANPERRMAKTLRAQFPGRVVLVEYDHRNDADAIKISEMGMPGTALEGVPMKVRLNRTEAIDSMMDSIRQRRNRPPLRPSQRYVDHLRALKRRTVISADGKVRRLYESTGSQGDDFAHAEVYDLAATELWRVRQGIQQIAAPEQQIPDEQIGFHRVRLTGDDDASYD